MNDYIERLVRDHPERAGELMDDGLATVLEVHFLCDCCFIPAGWQRYWRWIKDGNDPEAWPGPPWGG